MKTRKHKQWGGSKRKYSIGDKRKLASIGFTQNQIKFLNHVKQTYGIKNLNADGIVYLINENADGQLNPTSYTAFYENKYKDDAYTDNETDDDDDDDDNNISGGKSKSKTRKRRSRYSTKRETRRRRHKSIKRRNAAHKSRRRRA